MLSIAEAAQTIIKRSPYLTDALADGTINLSALARILHKQIQTEVKKDIKHGAIVVAIKRFERKLQKKKNDMHSRLGFGDITVRSNLIDVTYANSPTLTDKIRALFHEIGGRGDISCSISQGTFETTIIASAAIHKNIERIFAKERKIALFTDLSSICISLPGETTETPGSYAFVLKTLAWEGINLIEAVSTYRELTVVVRSEDIERAFTALKRSL